MNDEGSLLEINVARKCHSFSNQTSEAMGRPIHQGSDSVFRYDLVVRQYYDS